MCTPAGVGLFGNTILILVLWFGANLVIDGDMTTGALTSFLLYSIQVLSCAEWRPGWGGEVVAVFPPPTSLLCARLPEIANFPAGLASVPV